VPCSWCLYVLKEDFFIAINCLKFIIVVATVTANFITSLNLFKYDFTKRQ